MKIRHYLEKLQVVGLIAVTIPVVMSCSNLPKPGFSYAPTENPEAGEIIQFTNESEKATSFNWDFGDDGFSTQENPEYIFQQAGIFGVRLTALNEAGEESIIQSVTIYEPTVLGLQVFDSTGIHLLSGADLFIYDNEDDLFNMGEPLITGITDENGEVRFTNLEPIVYYFAAIKQVTGGLWGIALETPALNQNEENLFYFSCDWHPDEKKTTLTLSPAAAIRSVY